MIFSIVRLFSVVEMIAFYRAKVNRCRAVVHVILAKLKKQPTNFRFIFIKTPPRKISRRRKMHISTFSVLLYLSVSIIFSSREIIQILIKIIGEFT